MHLFGGKFRLRCFPVDPLADLPADADSDQTCTQRSIFLGTWAGGYTCPEGFVCTFRPPKGRSANPASGTVGFDNLAIAALSIFQTLTTEGWSNNMFWAMDCTNYFAALYFITVVIVGNYFLMQLVVRVVTGNLCRALELSAGEANLQRPVDRAAAVSIAAAALPQEKTEEISGHCARPRALCKAVVGHPWFNPVTSLCIAVNTACLGLRFYGMAHTYEQVLETTSVILMWGFVAEYLLQFCASGIEFLRQPANVADIIVTILGLIDAYTSPDFLAGFSAIRCFRLLRLAGRIPMCQAMLRVFSDSFPLLRALVALWVLFVWVFTLLGLQLFSGRFPEPLPRAHFETFGFALLSVLQLQTVENWNDLETSIARGVGVGWVTYCVVAIFLGSFILGQMVLAILISSLKTTLNEDVRRLRHGIMRMLHGMRGQMRRRRGIRSASPSPQHSRREAPMPDIILEWEDEPTTGQGHYEIVLDETAVELEPRLVESPRSVSFAGRLPPTPPASRATPNLLAPDDFLRPTVSFGPPRTRSTSRARTTSLRSAPNSETLAAVHPSPEGSTAGSFRHTVSIITGGALTRMPSGVNPTLDDGSVETPRSNEVEDDWAIPPIKREDPFRKQLRLLMDRPFATFLGMSLDVAIICLLVFEVSEQLTAAQSKITLATNIGFLLILLASLAVQTYVFGWRKLLRDPWRSIDAVFLGAHAAACGFGGIAPWLKPFRLCFVLRILKRSSGQRYMLSATLKTLPLLLGAVLPYLLFCLLMAIIGISLFSGSLWQCTDETQPDRTHCVGTYVDPATNLTMQTAWERYRSNYDNLPRSLLAVIVITMQEGWPDDMHRLMDIAGLNKQPIRDASPWNSVYSNTAYFLGNWLFISVVTQVIIENFTRSQDAVRGVHHLTAAQRRWLALTKAIARYRPNTAKAVVAAPEGFGVWDCFRRACHHIAISPLLPRLMLGVVTCDAIVLGALGFHDAPRSVRVIRALADCFFVALYTIEFVVLLSGLGWRGYRASRWNLLSLLVLFVSVPALNWSVRLEDPSPLRDIVLLRILRASQLFRQLIGAQALLRALSNCGWRLVHMVVLLLSGIFCFAVVGIAAFRNVNIDTAASLTPHVNWKSLPTAILTTYVAFTGENWPGMMDDLRVQPPLCSYTIGNCGKPWSPVYFLLLHSTLNWIVLYTFIAVLVDTFSDMLEQREWAQQREDLFAIIERNWIRRVRDPADCFWIPMPALLPLLRGVVSDCHHLGLWHNAQNLPVRRLPQTLLAMDEITVLSNKVHINDVLRGLLFPIFGSSLPPSLESNLATESRHAHLPGAIPLNKALAALNIQRVARGYLIRRQQSRPCYSG
eukprot:TRINITY_DN8424_c0_g1_i1.p1 TRINITY_DN8424_c0_g1~~TRINITY_DN8424_c0_g1_i1.p1  ORF type:complete len:1509 (+),score=172.74 TRINITY_DN8424_c0_g1_i1:505-4527(+)